MAVPQHGQWEKMEVSTEPARRLCLEIRVSRNSSNKEFQEEATRAEAEHCFQSLPLLSDVNWCCWSEPSVLGGTVSSFPVNFLGHHQIHRENGICGIHVRKKIMVRCLFEAPDEQHSLYKPSFQREALYLPIPLKIPPSWHCWGAFHSPPITNPLPQMHPMLLVGISVHQVSTLLSQMVGRGILPVPPSP